MQSGGAYRTAGETCDQELHPRVRLQAWGYWRWLKIDSELLHVGERFARQTVFKPNTEQTHIGHTELHFGKLMLTAACVPIKGRRPKRAAYRELLAEDNQLELFAEKRVKKNKIWAVILHVPNVASRQPLHIDVGFVTKDRTFAAPLIDLKRRVNAIEMPAVETVPQLRLRKQAQVSE